MSGLGADDRALIISEVLSRATADGITTPLLAEGITAAVEQIVTRAITAERNRLADEIEAQEVVGNDPLDWELGRNEAYSEVARIIRAHNT